MIDFLERVSQVEQRCRAFAMQLFARLVYFAPFSLVSSDGRMDALEGRPVNGAGDAYQRDARRVQHAGFRSMPKPTAQGVALCMEGGSTKLLIVAEDDGEDVSLASGEAMVYSPSDPTCRSWYDKDGNLWHIAADDKDVRITATGTGLVTVNGGSLKVARVTDSVDCGTLTLTVAAGVLGGSYVDPFGVTTVVTSGTALPLRGKITSGADRFKA